MCGEPGVAPENAGSAVASGHLAVYRERFARTKSPACQLPYV
jgi:hypothetical protein